MTKDLSYYQNAFSHLRRNNENGGAPHKPILLLSVLRLYQSGDLRASDIEPSPLLYHTFKYLWTKLVSDSSSFNPTFYYPFFHLRSEPFWRLVPQPSKHIPAGVTSIAQLNNFVAFASIDRELSALVLNPVCNTILEKTLVEQYFDVPYLSYTKIAVPSIESVLDKSTTIPCERKVSVVAKELEEDSYMRGQAFKVVIPQIYDHTCAISRLRLNSFEKSISMVDACHIIPFSESHDDSVGNGIALCPNLHRAFDRGLISISDDYTVLVSSSFAEDSSSVFALSQFEGQPIKLPYNESFYPNRDCLAAHRARWGFR